MIKQSLGQNNFFSFSLLFKGIQQSSWVCLLKMEKSQKSTHSTIQYALIQSPARELPYRRVGLWENHICQYSDQYYLCGLIGSVLLYPLYRYLITGSAISPCTTTSCGGGGRSAAGLELPDHSNACCGYWGAIHGDFRTLPL
jgi:hypothetical protein